MLIRPMTHEDAAAVAVLWMEGLQQTVDAAPWYIRPLIEPKIRQLGEQALQEDGDVGPQGKHLMKHWNDCPETEKRMFVAVLTEEEDNEQQEEGRIVGVVGVKKGFSFDDKKEKAKDEEEAVNDSTPAKKKDHGLLASIWRMSVDETFRRQGIGLELMQAAEQWARENGCTKMKLITGNSIAAKFYTDKVGYHRVYPPSAEASNNTLSWKERITARINHAMFSIWVGYYEKEI